MLSLYGDHGIAKFDQVLLLQCQELLANLLGFLLAGESNEDKIADDVVTSLKGGTTDEKERCSDEPQRKGGALARPSPVRQPFLTGAPSLFCIMDCIMRLQLSIMRVIFCCISPFIIMPGIIPP